MDISYEKALDFIQGNAGMTRHALGHFKAAMKNGYSSSAQEGTIVELPGSRTIEYHHNNWRVLDTYFLGPEGVRSGGTTMIWYGLIPVWMMQYLGYYEPDAIPCLKAALASIYLADQFNACRGPNCFPYEGSWVYANVVKNEHFVNARGVERIYDLVRGREVGWHRYQAQWLVGPVHYE